MPVDQTKVDDQANVAHVLWIGGASDAGKTTVSRLLAERHRWQWYPCDLHEHNHLIARADPERHPAISAEFQKTVEERWIQSTPEDLFLRVLQTNDERFPMILDDLRAMPARPMILVEGPRLFPKLAEYIRREVTARGLTMINVDGSLSPDELADQIDAHFAPYLASRAVV